MKRIISTGLVLAMILPALTMVLVAKPAVAAQTKALSARGIGVQLKERLRNLFGKPTPNASPTPSFCTQEAKRCPDETYVGRVPPKCEFATCPGTTRTVTPKPRKIEVATCKAAFDEVKKTYADAVKKARENFLAAIKKAINDYRVAYKLAREQKSNEAKKAARNAYQTARKAAQDKFSADKKAAKDAWQAAREIYNLCVKKPTVSPTP